MQRPEEYRLTPQTAAGTYLTNFSPILQQQNSTHDINKQIPAAPTGMYQQSTGAIPGPTPQHHQPGIGGPTPTAALVQGQQQMNRTHLANMGQFPPRNNPSQMSSIPRPPLTNIVQHGGPQGSQAYQPIQNVVLSHAPHPQIYHQFPLQMPVYQQRSMQYPIQQCPPQQIFTPNFYSTPAAPNPAYFHVSPCPPAVNNMPPQNQQSQMKREKKIIQIIDPDTGKNVMEDLTNDSSTESSRSASIHPSRENSRVGGSDPDVCTMFATQVAAKIKVQEPESKVISNSQSPDDVLKSCNEDPSNGDIPSVICDSYIEKEIDLQNSNVPFPECDRIDADSISDNIIIITSHKNDFKPVENESYNLVNHDTLNSVEDSTENCSASSLRGATDVKSLSEISLVSETSQDVEITICSNSTSSVESENVSNCVNEIKTEQIDSNCSANTDDSVLLQTTALRNEKPVEGKKAKGKKKKETINKKGDSKEGSEMDAFLVTDAEFVSQTVPSLPSSIVSVPEDVQRPTSPLLPLEPVTNHEGVESSSSLNENESSLQSEEEISDVKESSLSELDCANEATTNQEVLKPPMLKYAYKEDQWSPLNPEGKKHYDREFLIQMQAQPISLKKPLNLPNLDVIKDKAQIYKLSDVRTSPGIPLAPPRPFQGPFDSFMPNYARGGITRQSPHGGLGRRSQQGRDKPKKVISFSSSLNQAVKLHEASNAWKPQSSKPEIEQDEDTKNQEVYKKVRGILNKLTPQKFETLVKQVKELEINTEERLKNVIDLVFDKAVDEPNFSVPYANMCKQLAMLKVPLTDQEKYVNFRKLLLTKCQKEFEQDRNEELNKEEKLKEILKATSEEQKKQLREDLEEEEKKSRRRQLGNIRFIGELFKLGMLTELIMHECIKKLINQGDEDSLECLCRLLTTIGRELECKRDMRKGSDGNIDELKNKTPVMNEYFSLMQKIVDERKTSSRVRFMLQDVIDLRKNNWKPRRSDDNPKTIDQIHKEAEKEAQEQQQLLQNMPFPTKRLPDADRKRSSTGRNMNYEGSTDGGWTTTNKTSKLNLDPHKLSLSKPVEVDTMTLGPGGGRGFSNWGRGSSGGNKGNVEPERPSAILTNKYSVLANESMPIAQPGMEARNSQQSAASSRESSRGRNSQLPPQSLRKTPSASKERENVLETVSRFAKSAQPEQKPLEPKVPNMSSVNGKDISPVELRGPDSSEEEIEKRIKPLMDEFLHNADFKEAIKCITEIASSSTVHVLITAAINHVLERSSQARYLLGQLLHSLVQSKIVTMEQYNSGVKSILDFVDDYALDVPLIWEYLAEVLEPMVGGDILLTFLQDTLKPFSPSLTAAKLVAAFLHCASKKRGIAKVTELWKESGLEWSSFLTSQDLAEFLKSNNVEFTVNQTKAQETSETLDGALLQEKLDVYLRNDSQNNDQIFDWIESHVGDKVSEPTFIRALVTSIYENSITGPVEKCELNTDRVKARLPIIQHYIINNKDAELQALYALQALLVRLKQPKGILNQIFNFLYDEEIICDETFYSWEESTDPSEQEGKGVALNSVSPFFSWLREADNDESADDG